VAAGAFALAGVIHVFQRKDLYGLGRTAVLMGLLSYSFVTVTLIADLGLPWQAYQLALQAPEHSAMFEVSWCVGLYVTILLLEFLPVPLAHFGYTRATEALRRWNGAYVAAAVTLFVYLLSRDPVLPDVRIPSRDGPAGRRRSRAQASALVRLLRHALAVQANRMPIL